MRKHLEILVLFFVLQSCGDSTTGIEKIS